MKEVIEDLWPYNYYVEGTIDRILELLKRLVIKANRSGLDGCEVTSVVITKGEGNLFRITTDMKVNGKVHKIRE